MELEGGVEEEVVVVVVVWRRYRRIKQTKRLRATFAD